ncbi:MAG: hypothetical protein FJ298_09450 [Planctomycetes bacterium]|nr:hypothetical protein [Planctomycetota bacterium]
MADQLDWGSEASEPVKPKRRVPVWAWFCGGGCVLMFVTFIVASVAVVSCVKEMADPDTQWKELEKVVAVETRPEGEIFGMKIPFQNLRVISIQQGLTKVDFMIAGGAQAQELRSQFLDPSAEMNLGPMLGNLGRYEPEEIVLNVQGRELRGLRFLTQKPDGEGVALENTQDEEPAELEPVEAVKLAMRQSTVALDISPEGGTKTVILQYSRMGSLEKIDDDEVIEFLAHFKLGSGN